LRCEEHTLPDNICLRCKYKPPLTRDIHDDVSAKIYNPLGFEDGWPKTETLAAGMGTGIDGAAKTFGTPVAILSSEQDATEDRPTDQNIRVTQIIDFQLTFRNVLIPLFPSLKTPLRVLTYSTALSPLSVFWRRLMARWKDLVLPFLMVVVASAETKNCLLGAPPKFSFLIFVCQWLTWRVATSPGGGDPCCGCSTRCVTYIPWALSIRNW
jgi:hypothetical protein